MKSTKFFCENCGTEVKRNARICPTCGRFFSAVRCPVCNYTGQGEEFVRGCPNCGYSGSAGGAGGKKGFSSGEIAEIYGMEEIGVGSEREPASRGKQKAPIPPWVYWLAMGILTVSLIVLILIYLNM